MAIGVGVFLGCTPFFGFHTLLAIVVSFVFGLNFVYVWVGTQISNPFFAGFLTAGSIGLGRYLLHDASYSVGRLTLDWLAGSVVVGSVLGTISGVVSYCTAQHFRKQTETGAAASASVGWLAD